MILLSLTDKKNKEFLAWVKFVIPLGAVIVIGGLSEAILRLCFFKNKHNFFDTLAVLAGAGSMYGVVLLRSVPPKFSLNICFYSGIRNSLFIWALSTAETSW